MKYESDSEKRERDPQPEVKPLKPPKKQGSPQLKNGFAVMSGVLAEAVDAK